jgi:hypothetical protein
MVEHVVWPYIEACDRVVGLRIHADDIDVHRKMDRWFELRTKHWSLVTRFLNPAKPRFVRCKYCGRYKDRNIESLGEYIASGETYCQHCERKYPEPSVYWDSLQGQSYIFYRRSVPTKEPFYQNFVERFDVKYFNDDQFGAPIKFDLPERYRAMLGEEEFWHHRRRPPCSFCGQPAFYEWQPAPDETMANPPRCYVCDPKRESIWVGGQSVQSIPIPHKGEQSD